MVYFQKLKVLILVAWPNCCLNDCIVDFPLPLLQLHLALKLIPNTNNCVMLLSFLALLCFVVLHVFKEYSYTPSNTPAWTCRCDIVTVLPYFPIPVEVKQEEESFTGLAFNPLHGSSFSTNKSLVCPSTANTRNCISAMHM